MPENLPEKAYKHQVTAKVFEEAFTTLKWTAEQTNKFNALGIERLSGVEFEKRGIVKQKIYNSQEYTVISNAEVIGQIEINKIAEALPHWVINDSLLPEVFILNCQWAGQETRVERILEATTLSIINSKTQNFTIWDNSKIGNFRILNSIMGDFRIWGSELSDIDIESSEMGAINVFYHSSAENIAIGNSCLNNIEIYDNSNVGNFTITDSNMHDFKIWNKCVSGYFEIGDSNIGNFSIWDNCVTRFINIKSSTTGNFKINNSSVSTSINIDGVFASFNFSNVIIRQCYLTNCNIPQLRIENECSIELYIGGGIINHINFDKLTIGKNSILSFSDANVYVCNMTEFAMLGNLYFRGVKKAEKVFDWLEIESVLSQKFAPDEIEKKGEKYQRTEQTLLEQKEGYAKHSQELLQRFQQATFRVSQSSLGKTEFTECELGKFNFEYNNSKITEVFISGGTVPERDINILGEKEETKGWFQQKVSIYNQLKKVFAAQGDVYYESVFHAQTSHHQLYLLRYMRKEKNYNWFKWMFSEETYDIITFRLNQLSNKHGASWGRALFFVLVIPFFIYLAYLKAAGLLYFDVNSSIDCDLLGNYFTVLNPTHKTDFMPSTYPVSYNFWTNCWDFLGRIIVGYGIYQFISAFRKHGKKG